MWSAHFLYICFLTKLLKKHIGIHTEFQKSGMWNPEREVGFWDKSRDNLAQIVTSGNSNNKWNDEDFYIVKVLTKELSFTYLLEDKVNEIKKVSPYFFFFFSENFYESFSASSHFYLRLLMIGGTPSNHYTVPRCKQLNNL